MRSLFLYCEKASYGIRDRCWHVTSSIVNLMTFLAFLAEILLLGGVACDDDGQRNSLGTYLDANKPSVQDTGVKNSQNIVDIVDGDREEPDDLETNSVSRVNEEASIKPYEDTGISAGLDAATDLDAHAPFDKDGSIDLDSRVDSKEDASEWEVVFEDDFDGQNLDLSKWSYNYPWGNGHVHNHRAWCVEENVIVENGLLRIKGENRRHPDAIAQGLDDEYDYTSGIVTTYGRFYTRYGLIEGRFKGPGVRGSWPAFWTLQDGWPPEIDILEIPYSDTGPGYRKTDHHYYLHYTPPSGGEKSFGGYHVGPDKSADFHTYAVLWTPGHLIFYFDGQRIEDQHCPEEVDQCQQMYLLVNLAIGGWGGDPSTNPSDYPYYYEADWIRVSKPRYKVVNGDFEYSYHSPWTAVDGWEGISFDVSNPYNGSQALLMEDSSLFQIIALESNRAYRLEFAGRVEEGAQMDVHIQDLGSQDNNFQVIETDWELFVYDFETGSTNLQPRIVTQGVGRVYLDAVRIIER